MATPGLETRVEQDKDSRMLRRLHRFLRFLAGGAAAAGVAAGALAQDLALTRHAQPDGLSNLAVTGLMQMPDGRLLIGTENGLYRHDGARISRVDERDAPIGNRLVSGLAPDGRGGFWVAMINGVFHLDERGLEPVDMGQSKIVVRQGQRSIAATAEGGALVAAFDGLYAVRRDAADGRLRASPAFPQALRDREPSLTAIHSVLVEPDGGWWLGCGQALCHWRSGALRRFGEREGVKPARWANVLRTRDGALWARSQEQVLRAAPGETRFEDFTPKRLSQGTVLLHQPLVEDRQGRILTSSDAGLLRWESGRWTRFGEAQGLESGGISAVLQDRDRDLWIGTAGHGLVHWRGYEHWRHWTRRQGVASDDVWSFLDDSNGRLWLGTGSGVTLIDTAGATVPAIPLPRRGTTDQVGGLARDASGQIWMATYSGELLRLRGGAWQRVAEGLPLVLMLHASPDGALWLGADKGLHVVPPSETSAERPKLLPAPGMEPERALSMTVFAACTTPSRRTWFATSAGMMAHDADAGITQPAIAQLPAGMAVEQIACGRDGTVWAGTRDGRLWRVSGSGASWRAQALPSDAALGRRSVMALLSDRRGWLWATTDDGVLVWNGRAWRRFDESNGLGWNDCNQGALHEDVSGGIWIGTSRGATQVLAPERLLDPVRVDLHFTQLTRDGRDMPRDRAWTADWSAGALQIAWAAPAFMNRSSQQVRYRLRGLSEEWSTTPHDDVSFPALAGGRYVFEARVENPDLGVTSDIASLSFEIRPPWWRSGWAWAAYAASAAALVALVYRWRMRAWVRRQRELEALVGLRTAELKESYEQMRTLALTDGLTGAMNRRAIADLAARELARARRGEAAVTLMLIDIDHFKRINDTHGHPAGDAVLVQLVRRLRLTMRDYDAIGRWGGEEFLLLLPGMSLAQADGRRRVEHLQRSVGAQPFDIGAGEPLSATCSAGAIGVEAGDDASLEALIERVDAALYDAKHGGRNRSVIAS